MKKIFALLLMLTMLLTGTALAEDGYIWYQYEDGFEIMVPSSWDQCEITEDLAAVGIFDMFAPADSSCVATIAWIALETEMTMEELLISSAETYPDAIIIEINDIEFLGFADEEYATACFCALDDAEPGMYIFTFTGTDSDEEVALALAMLASIRNIE